MLIRIGNFPIECVQRRRLQGRIVAKRTRSPLITFGWVSRHIGKNSGKTYQISMDNFWMSFKSYWQGLIIRRKTWDEVITKVHPTKGTSLINKRTLVSDDLLQCQCHDVVWYPPNPHYTSREKKSHIGIEPKTHARGLVTYMMDNHCLQ